MRKQNLFEKLKSWISSLGWNMFIWGLDITQEEYWERIYQQEKEFKKRNNQEEVYTKGDMYKAFGFGQMNNSSQDFKEFIEQIKNK